MEVLEIIKQHPIIPVFYHDDPQVCKDVLKACYAGGVRVFEFVDRGAKALANFKQLQDFRNENFKDLKLGIGTIKTTAQAIEFIKIKTDFIVSPIFNLEIAAKTKEHSTPWFPGCMTPTEVSWAIGAGCKLIKIFPGNIVGAQFIKALRSVFPEVDFMPTGGVKLTQENLQNWFDSGVVAVGIGSSLFKNVEDLKGIQSSLQQGFEMIKQRK